MTQAESKSVEKDLKVIIENLVKVRKRLDINQEALADMIGLDRSTVAGYEQGRRRPSLEYILTYCDIMKVDLSDLFEGVSSYKRNPHDIISDPKVSVAKSTTTEDDEPFEILVKINTKTAKGREMLRHLIGN